MYEIKNINPFSLGKTLALIAGTIFVVCFGMFILFLFGIGEIDLDDLFYEEVGLVFVIGIAVSAVGFFVGGILGAFVYNKTAERFGGIKLDIAFGGDEQDEQTNQEKNV